MSKLLTPNEILSAYQAVATLVKIIPDHDLMVDFRGSKVVSSQILADIIIEAKTVIAESVESINETIKSILPDATLSVKINDSGEVIGFKVDLGFNGFSDYSDYFYLFNSESGDGMQIENATFRKAEANLIKSYLELLNEAKENSEQL